MHKGGCGLLRAGEICSAGSVGLPRQRAACKLHGLGAVLARRDSLHGLFLHTRHSLGCCLLLQLSLQLRGLWLHVGDDGLSLRPAAHSLGLSSLGSWHSFDLARGAGLGCPCAARTLGLLARRAALCRPGLSALLRDNGPGGEGARKDAAGSAAVHLGGAGNERRRGAAWQAAAKALRHGTDPAANTRGQGAALQAAVKALLHGADAAANIRRREAA
mmetsp:Transcript_60274/g.155206  ORF Transcript_60274/g.155206 Transcript_60274/m.155206 type:complete len:217 (-) Transcript_60274:249-899(-)